MLMKSPGDQKKLPDGKCSGGTYQRRRIFYYSPLKMEKSCQTGS
jgi:hypothetical protein